MVGLSLLLLLAAACGEPAETGPTLAASPPDRPEAMIAAVQTASGDRRTEGSGDITRVDPIEIDAGIAVEWVVAAPMGDGITVVAVLTDGTAVTIEVSGSSVGDPVLLGPAPMGPPVVAVGPGGVSFVAPDPMSLAPPLVTDDVVWWTATDGSVHRGDEPLDLVGLPDGRIVAAADGSIAILTDPTTRYPHGVLGDAVEAGTVTILEPDGTIRAVTDIDGVIEGLSPMWADLDGDGTDELIVTVSDAAEGARIVVLDRTGVPIATGEPIGIGNRWRHQVGTVRDPFGVRAVVVVKTPHIGGVAEYWRLGGDALELVTARPGVTSHTLGSRNLDLAVIVDADGDDVEELVAPTGDLRSLVGLFLTEDGVGESWRFELPASLASNLSTVTNGDGAWLVAGLSDGRILVWPPEPLE